MYFMLLLLLSTLFMAASPALAATPITISFAEQPVRLLRDKGFYLAGRGAQLQNGDIIESGSSPIQIDDRGSSTLALGPGSRLYVRTDPKGSEYLLLGGWLKLQSRDPKDGTRAGVRSAGLLVEPGAASIIVRASPGKAELFVESGHTGVAEPYPGKVLRRATVAREQYAVLGSGQPLKVMPRAPKEFLGAMPPAFFDSLVPVASKGATPAPKPERAATYAEIAPWLAEQPDLRQAIHRRFHPPKPAPRRPTHPTAKDPS